MQAIETIASNKKYQVIRWQQFADGGNVWYDVSVIRGRRNKVAVYLKHYKTKAAAMRCFNTLTARYNQTHTEQI